MKSDIPIFGQPKQDSNSLLGELVARETIRMLDNALKLENIIKINELYKNCGVERPAAKTTMTINVRRPPRYAKAD